MRRHPLLPELLEIARVACQWVQAYFSGDLQFIGRETAASHPAQGRARRLGLLSWGTADFVGLAKVILCGCGKTEAVDSNTIKDDLARAATEVPEMEVADLGDAAESWLRRQTAVGRGGKLVSGSGDELAQNDPFAAGGVALRHRPSQLGECDQGTAGRVCVAEQGMCLMSFREGETALSLACLN